MLKFPDNRNRFRGVPQWSINPGQANPDNPVKHPDPFSQTATRAPLGAFRVSTTTDPVLLQQQAEKEALANREKELIVKPIIDVPSEASFDLDGNQSSLINWSGGNAVSVAPISLTEKIDERQE